MSSNEENELIIHDFYILEHLKDLHTDLFVYY